MVTRHLTNTEFELLVEGKTGQLSQFIRAHAEQCSQCKQELAELSSVFHWPSNTKTSHAVEPLADRVLSELAQRKQSSSAFRILISVGLLSAVVILAALAPMLWQYLPEQAKTAAMGLFPIMEWLPVFQKLLSAEWWLTSSAVSLLAGGLVTLSLIMLFDSVIIGRLLRKLKAKQASPVLRKQMSQGNRT